MNRTPVTVPTVGLSIAVVIERGPQWRRAAACVLVDPEIFYPVDQTPGSPAVTAAKRICTGCLVRTVCLSEVMAGEDPARRWGITGGLTPAERTARYARLRRVSARSRAGVAA